MKSGKKQKKWLKINHKKFAYNLQRSTKPCMNHESPEVINNYAGNPSEVTPQKLQQDAVAIHNEIQTLYPTHASKYTIFCTALKEHIFNGIKKVVFCNTNLHKDVRKKAEELGYHVIKTEHSHAETGFVQFMFKRDRLNHGYYTHLAAMGCDKDHCRECDLLLKLVLGTGYLDTKFNAGKVRVAKKCHEDLSNKFYLSDDLVTMLSQYTGKRIITKGRYNEQETQKDRRQQRLQQDDQFIYDPSYYPSSRVETKDQPTRRSKRNLPAIDYKEDSSNKKRRLG